MRSYGKILNLGHKQIEQLLDGPVVIEEKVDGSQFSFWKEEYVYFRSKNQLLIPNNAGMFDKAIGSVLEVSSLFPDYTLYRAEYLRKPKHNTLAYDRTPDGHLALFDVERGEGDYYSLTEKKTEADKLGIECVPVLFVGQITSKEQLDELLDTESFLGGQKIEGLVIKAYGRFQEGKLLCGKYVSSRFREMHTKDWKLRHPGPTDIRDQLVDSLRTEARWEKAVFHLREAGCLEGSARDIGPLIKEASEDTMSECEEFIKQKLYEWASKHISRGITRGLPEWYKEKLANESCKTI